MTDPKPTRLTHLQRLESESIHIPREVVAEAERPVVNRGGTLIMVGDERMRLEPGEVPMEKKKLEGYF